MMRSTLPVAAATKRMDGCWHRRSAISSIRERSILSPIITGDSKPPWNGSTAPTIRPQRVDDRDAEAVLETAGEGVEPEAHAPEEDCLGALLEQPAADRRQPPQRVLGVRDQLVELETDGVYADASRADLEA